MHSIEEKLAAFERLLKIMGELREQCPWDRKQTYETLRHLTIEETYELSEAILDSNLDEIQNETGDLLLHMVFYAQIASETSREQGGWDIADSLNGICDKLIDRHHHIYGDVELRSGQHFSHYGIPNDATITVVRTSEWATFQ